AFGCPLPPCRNFWCEISNGCLYCSQTSCILKKNMCTRRRSLGKGEIEFEQVVASATGHFRLHKTRSTGKGLPPLRTGNRGSGGARLQLHRSWPSGPS